MRGVPIQQLAVLSMCLVARAGEFDFVDESSCDGRSVLQFRTVVLGDTPPRPLDSTDGVPPDAKYGLLPVGADAESALQLVWNADSADAPLLAIDVDQNGRLGRDERFEFDQGKVEVLVQVPTVGKRTLVLRRASASDGLLYAVRGYMSGSLAIGAAEHRAALVDGNADGLFDGPGADRLWVDLDDDGHFDALSEHFLLGTPLTLDDGVFTVSVDAAGRHLQAHRRSDRKGWLNLAWGRAAAAAPESMQQATVDLVSHLGELTSVRQATGAVQVPVGDYRIASLMLQLKDSDGRVWEYQFAGRGTYDHRVTEDAPTTVEPLAGLEPRIELSVRGSPGDAEQTVVVKPTLIARSGLYLAHCSVRRPPDPVATPTQAEIRLLGQGGKVFAKALSGFA